MRRLILFGLILILSVSCGFLKKKFTYIGSNSDIPRETDEGIRRHLTSLSSSYLNTPSIVQINLKKESKAYLQGIYRRISRNNELLLPLDKVIRFYFIKETVPFIFSLPDGHIFLSSGLFLKHLKNESLLISALTFEYIKSFRGLYRKREIIPVGYITTPHIISLTQVDLDIKMEINKWSYKAMKRAGYDPSAILAWIQTQNRNTLDFMMLNGDERAISREEFSFKNFLAAREEKSEKIVQFENSSIGFYHLVSDIKGKGL